MKTDQVYHEHIDLNEFKECDLKLILVLGSSSQHRKSVMNYLKEVKSVFTTVVQLAKT